MELLRRPQPSRGLHLFIADGVHELYPSEGHSGRPEGLEPRHRSYLTFDHSVVLFYDVVEVLDLPKVNLRIVVLDCCRVGAAIVDGNRRRRVTDTSTGS